MAGKPILHLTDPQSIRVHGWFNPKRSLCWEDILNTPHMTVPHLIRAGVTPKQLKKLQPNIQEWIEGRGVSFEDVPFMTDWPLHPITHLQGDLSVVVNYRYAPELLVQLGMDYKALVALGLNPQWMQLMDFSLKEWVMLGMGEDDVAEMSEYDVNSLFGSPTPSVLLCIAMVNNCTATQVPCDG